MQTRFATIAVWMLVFFATSSAFRGEAAAGEQDNEHISGCV